MSVTKFEGDFMYYFAYGSNMDPERMKKRGVKFSLRVRAVLKGYALKFDKVVSGNSEEGYANIVKDEHSEVEGVLYEIYQEGLEKLDSCEGCPSHYKQITVKVLLDDGKEVEAKTYIANSEKIKEGLKPRKEYLSHLLAASDVLSPEYIKKLEKTSTYD